ncbi:hypothetical protein KC325_g308 [Hortaea werneckii]|nr:hypothetical protein KC325_g308 [Hortaea werneckii]
MLRSTTMLLALLLSNLFAHDLHPFVGILMRDWPKQDLHQVATGLNFDDVQDEPLMKRDFSVNVSSPPPLVAPERSDSLLFAVPRSILSDQAVQRKDVGKLDHQSAPQAPACRTYARGIHASAPATLRSSCSEAASSACALGSGRDQRHPRSRVHEGQAKDMTSTSMTQPGRQGIRGLREGTARTIHGGSTSERIAHQTITEISQVLQVLNVSRSDVVLADGSLSRQVSWSHACLASGKLFVVDYAPVDLQWVALQVKVRSARRSAKVAEHHALVEGPTLLSEELVQVLRVADEHLLTSAEQLQQVELLALLLRISEQGVPSMMAEPGAGRRTPRSLRASSCCSCSRPSNPLRSGCDRRSEYLGGEAGMPSHQNASALNQLIPPNTLNDLSPHAFGF